MTNLDSIFKSRDITLPTKVRLVKAMVFLVVMYGYESWIVKSPDEDHVVGSPYCSHSPPPHVIISSHLSRVLALNWGRF